ncbi:MAG TPA: RNA methyltransferase [Candidatus Polarisedimenticolaceae bacterium]|nr:RNA methyltransferase [Candidatus Polarisedimenticolaceae bacterium]
MPPEDELPPEELLYGVHPVLEALTTRLRSVERLFVAREGTAGPAGRLLRLARRAGIPVSHVPRAVLARRLGRNAVHQGIAAAVAPLPYADPESVCAAAAADPAGVLLLLDRVTDPRNLGAILRTAAAAGVHGVLLGEGSVGLTPAALKTSAGVAGHLPVAREPKPAARLEALGRAGFRCLALDPRGAVPWDRADLSGRLLLVIGGEGPGLRPGLATRAEHRLAIPLAPGVESLNVSVSVGVILFEAVRQRRAIERGGDGW